MHLPGLLLLNPEGIKDGQGGELSMFHFGNLSACLKNLAILGGILSLLGSQSLGGGGRPGGTGGTGETDGLGVGRTAAESTERARGGGGGRRDANAAGAADGADGAERRSVQRSGVGGGRSLLGRRRGAPPP